MKTDDRVVVHSSWRGILAAFLAPSLLMAVMAAAWWRIPRVSGGLVGVGVMAIGLLAVAIFDYPIRTEVGEEGLRRVCLGRRQLIRWSAVRSLGRGRGAILSARTRERVSARAAGPLVAKVGRKTLLLVDQCESVTEHTAICQVVERYAPHVELPTRPPASAPPTHLYRGGGSGRRTPG